MKAHVIGRFFVPDDKNRELFELIEKIHERYPDAEIKLILYPEGKDMEDAVERLIDATIDVIEDMNVLEEELGVAEVETWPSGDDEE